MRVVLVHGWHMTGWEMALFGRRLARAGHSVKRFRYRSRRESPMAAGARLAATLQAEAGPVALIGHSLGGHVIRHALAVLHHGPSASNGVAHGCVADQRVAAVAFLGSPLNGSAVARRLVERGGWRRRWIGSAWAGGLDGTSPPVIGVPTLMIAGTRPGWSRWLTHGLAVPNDGTVAVSETCASDVCEHQSIAASHMGLLIHPGVAEAVAGFLARVPLDGTMSGQTSRRVDGRT